MDKYSDFIELFAKKGYYNLPSVLDRGKANELVKFVRSQRFFDPSIFLTEEEWDASPKTHRGTNPNINNNILEQCPQLVDGLLKNERLTELLEQLLGKNFRWLYQKIVCRTPATIIPDWVHKGIAGFSTTTLGAYIKPQYRDISYLYDHDIHQDLLDWPRMEPKDHRMITLIVDLEETPAPDTPICVFPESHHLGVTHFPPKLKHITGNQWTYEDDNHNSMNLQIARIPDAFGQVSLWHGCMLHGAKPLLEGPARLVLRCLLLRSETAEHCGLDLATSSKHDPSHMATPYTSGMYQNADGFVCIPPSDFLRVQV